MPDLREHLTAVGQNQQVLRFLERSSEHCGWRVVVIFYIAVHLVEAYLARRPAPPNHTDKHTRRNKEMRLHFPAPIFQHYRYLKEKSEDARYNCVPFTEGIVETQIKPSLRAVGGYIGPLLR